MIRAMLLSKIHEFFNQNDNEKMKKKSIKNISTCIFLFICTLYAMKFACIKKTCNKTK